VVLALPPASKPTVLVRGNWIVTGNETRANQVIVLLGSLMVMPGGNLTLLNVELYLNCRYDGEWNITVEEGGFLKAEGSVVASYDYRYAYSFYVYGHLVLLNSTVFDCGYSWEEPGLLVDHGHAVLENVLIAYCCCGLCACNSSTVVMEGCEVRDNIDGVVVESGSSALLKSCTFESNGYGAYFYSSASCKVEDCAFYRNCYGVACECSSGISVESCVISDNNRDGVYCVYSSDILVKRCKISSNWNDGVHCHYARNVSVVECTLSNNMGGVLLFEVQSATVANNTFLNDGLVVESYSLGGYLHRVENNTVNGKALLYLVNQSSCEVSEQAGQVVVVNSEDVLISEAEFSNVDVPILAAYSRNVEVRHVKLSENAYCAVYADSSTLSIAYCDIRGNRYGILSYYSKLEVRYCNICDNLAFGIYSEGPYEVDAKYNWWGSPEGPERTEVPDPESPEEVCGNVSFLPFLEEPYYTVQTKTKPKAPASVPALLLLIAAVASVASLALRGKAFFKTPRRAFSSSFSCPS